MLFQEVRPKTFDEFTGNRVQVEALKRAVSNPDRRSHAYLFFGPSGCGKTTLARILAGEFLCPDDAFHRIEINAASQRGIDMARKLEEIAGASPMGGGSRAVILDECFVGGTLITKADGLRIPIERINPGDRVQTMGGPATVMACLRKQVSNDRMLRLNFTNGTSIQCTSNHRFWTGRSGWKQAKNLTKQDILLCPLSTHAYNRIEEVSNRQETREDLREVRVEVPGQAGPEILQLRLLGKGKGSCQAKDRSQTNMRMVRPRVYCKEERNPFLRLLVRSKVSSKPPDKQREITRNEAEDIGIKQTNIPQKALVGGGVQESNVKEQSDVQSGNSKAHGGYLTKGQARIQGTWWEWSSAPKAASPASRTVGLADRSVSITRATKERISNTLQDRYCQSRTEDRHRGRWQNTQYVSPKSIRRKEGSGLRDIRLVSSPVYKREYHVQPDGDCEGSSDDSGGTTTVYDLQIDGHPSYFANGILVHNCHSLTKDAQNALLKVLEDIPSYTYYLLCSTEPKRLLPTILTRCEKVEVSKLDEDRIVAMLDAAIKASGIDDPGDDVLDAIAENADGCPREALVMLEKQSGMAEADAIAVVRSHLTHDKAVIDLCRKVLSGPWKAVAAAYNRLGDKEPEKVRRAILGYLKSCVLKSDKGGEAERFVAATEELVEPTYDSGEPGLVAMLYRATAAMKT